MLSFCLIFIEFCSLHPEALPFPYLFANFSSKGWRHLNVSVLDMCDATELLVSQSSKMALDYAQENGYDDIIALLEPPSTA